MVGPELQLEAVRDQAQRAGTVRADVTAADIKTLIVGLQAMRRFRGDGELMRRVYPVIRAGLAVPNPAETST
ncbi:SbtR family transcriptional regulator [Streptosporangium sp. NBC_01469]|uniref:SbtR family transcriptional regulator n=1 Tax=Streptosporangium sp. NBC_01469 TaxID=2903898 RepID=UPI002E2C6D29|nr:hypothetical protein [Streptosporangium sp. NBC_01469]